MTDDRITGHPAQGDELRGQAMKTPDDVAMMLGLKACGWGAKRDRAGAGLQPSHCEGKGLEGDTQSIGASGLEMRACQTVELDAPR
jgi:hypothetical protein